MKISKLFKNIIDQSQAVLLIKGDAATKHFCYQKQTKLQDILNCVPILKRKRLGYKARANGHKEKMVYKDGKFVFKFDKHDFLK